MSIYKPLFVSLTAVIVAVSTSFAAPQPLNIRHDITLSDFEGRTFLNVMLAQNGIKAALDHDYEDTYTIASAETLMLALKNFDSKIIRRVQGAFGRSPSRFRRYAESIEGKQFKPSNLIGLIRSTYRGNGNLYALEHFIGIASGASTLVRINKDNYYYNYGYKSGKDRDDVRSGRSYGAAPLHNANDASDIMYLNELGNYLKSSQNPAVLYRTIMEVLTQTQSRGFDRLSPLGQTTATDWLAIYTAELDRHIMVRLDPRRHPWENDLTEATFMAVFTAMTGKIMENGRLVEGRVRDYWAMSSVSNRSGIGIKRGDRRYLQRIISTFVRGNNSRLSSRIDDLLDGRRRDGDLFRGLMEFLNNIRTQGTVKRNAVEITDAYVELITYVANNVRDIENFVENWRR